MGFSCINISENQKAKKIISKIKKVSKNLELAESKFFTDSVVMLLSRLASEEDNFMQIDKIRLAFNHLARSRKCLEYLDDSREMAQIDSLIDEAISIISSDILYLIRHAPDGVEQ